MLKYNSHKSNGVLVGGELNKKKENTSSVAEPQLQLIAVTEPEQLFNYGP